MHTKTRLLAYRNSMAELADDLSEEDRTWRLCRRTGRSYADLLSVAAQVGGDRLRFLEEVGYSPKRSNGNWYRWDGGHWAMILAWMRNFVPQWEAGVRHYVSEDTQNRMALMDAEGQDRVLQAAAKALNIAPEVLTHFVEHRHEIELFLEAARATLGTLAESKLWELVMSGDAATIRWLLPRIKSDVFGDRLEGGAGADRSPRTIRIIDVTTEEA
jgi:hypothetical protein